MLKFREVQSNPDKIAVFTDAGMRVGTINFSLDYGWGLTHIYGEDGLGRQDLKEVRRKLKELNNANI